MAFWKKKAEKRKRELEGIKNKVEGIQPAMPKPPEVPTPRPPEPIPEPKPVPKVPKKETVVPEPSAPLFIKIEKYDDVLGRIDDLKKTLQTLTRLISFHNEVDELKQDIFSRIKANVSTLTDILISMDEIFLKPEKSKKEGKKKGEGGDIDEQMLDLGEELRHLKRELNKI